VQRQRYLPSGSGLPRQRAARNAAALGGALVLSLGLALLAVSPARAARDVIVDTDIGDDIDDAFALALVLRAPELHLLGVITSFGDTGLRARLARLELGAAGRGDVAVAGGPATAPRTLFTQSRLALRGPRRDGPDGVSFLLAQLRSRPAHSVTLIAIAPPSTIGAAIARDPATFRRLAGVVMMGGSIDVGYAGGKPQPEYNLASDPAGMRALLHAGVPLTLLPVDSTEIRLPEMVRDRIFAAGSGLTDTLTLAWAQWAARNKWGPVPTVFDVVPVALLLAPRLCPTETLRISVDDTGMTRRAADGVAIRVCLRSDHDGIVSLLERRLVQASDKP